MSSQKRNSDTGVIRTYLSIGYLSLVVLFVGIGGWAALASINGAVIGSGLVIQKGKNIKVQHSEGGTIRKVHIQEGDLVEAGQLLITIEGARIIAEYDVLVRRLEEFQVERQRLIAQRNGEIEFRVDHVTKKTLTHNKELLSYIAVQEKLFAAGQNRLRNKKQQLLERNKSQKNEIAGLNTQISAALSKKSMLSDEISLIQNLHKKQLVTKRRLNELHKENIDTDSQLGRLKSNVAKIRGQIAETNLEKIELDENFQQETLEELEQVESKIQELREKIIAAKDRLDNLEIRAPQNGYIHELKYASIGGVISSGENIMQLVPNTQDLSIEAKVRPTDIDQVQLGATATVSFPSLNQKTTPFIKAEVIFLSPDQSIDERSGESYFTVRLLVEPEEIAKLGEKNIAVGIPAEVMIETGSRTVLSYLVKPFTDQLDRTFRED